ncbi:MAG: hypothetical protein UY12_C0027G0002 [Parcubacteria group bacterium GW2011_GWA2_47_8b]|nr:MAG: hypothetical protein UY12_C0027G0002 [Parcubacteria group bacterium GW2011_GWA2_47_8b]
MEQDHLLLRRGTLLCREVLVGDVWIHVVLLAGLDQFVDGEIVPGVDLESFGLRVLQERGQAEVFELLPAPRCVLDDVAQVIRLGIGLKHLPEVLLEGREVPELGPELLGELLGVPEVPDFTLLAFVVLEIPCRPDGVMAEKIVVLGAFQELPGSLLGQKLVIQVQNLFFSVSLYLNPGNELTHRCLLS